MGFFCYFIFQVPNNIHLRGPGNLHSPPDETKTKWPGLPPVLGLWVPRLLRCAELLSSYKWRLDRGQNKGAQSKYAVWREWIIRDWPDLTSGTVGSNLTKKLKLVLKFTKTLPTYSTDVQTKTHQPPCPSPNHLTCWWTKRAPSR